MNTIARDLTKLQLVYLHRIDLSSIVSEYYRRTKHSEQKHSEHFVVDPPFPPFPPSYLLHSTEGEGQEVKLPKYLTHN